MMRSLQKIPAASMIFLFLSLFISNTPFPAFAGCWPATDGSGGLSRVCGGSPPKDLKTGFGNDRKAVDTSPGRVGAWMAGKDGGEGKDLIRNDGTRMVSTPAILDEGGASLTLTGGDETTAATSVQSNAVGIDGGKGQNKIINSGTVTHTAIAEVTRIQSELNLADTSHGDTSTYIRARATGISRGNGKDEIINTGTIVAETFARSTSVNIEVNRFDAATGDSKLEVESLRSALRAARERPRSTTAGL